MNKTNSINNSAFMKIRLYSSKLKIKRRSHLSIISILIMLSFNLSFPFILGAKANRSINSTSINLPEDNKFAMNIQKLTLSASDLKYTFTGSLSDNGDGYWDSSENDLYEFEIKSDQVFRATIDLGRNVDGVFLMLFNGDSEEDIEDAMVDLVYYGYSDRIYDIDLAENSFASL